MTRAERPFIPIGVLLHEALRDAVCDNIMIAYSQMTLCAWRTYDTFAVLHFVSSY